MGSASAGWQRPNSQMGQGGTATGLHGGEGKSPTAVLPAGISPPGPPTLRLRRLAANIALPRLRHRPPQAHKSGRNKGERGPRRTGLAPPGARLEGARPQGPQGLRCAGGLHPTAGTPKTCCSRRGLTPAPQHLGAPRKWARGRSRLPDLGAAVTQQTKGSSSCELINPLKIKPSSQELQTKETKTTRPAG